VTIKINIYYFLSEHNTVTCFDHYVVVFRALKNMKYRNNIISKVKKTQLFAENII